MATKKTVIPEAIQQDYLRRLKTPYIKKGEEKSFFEQYQRGSGQEIKDGKFWRTISSSRLCFDLYSWMADDIGYDDIEVEKKLPGIISGKKEISPNMDVFFETSSEIFFIESKYTEEVSGQFSIPEAYWVETDEYHTTKGDLTNKPILARYRGYTDVKDAFVSFIKYVKKLESQRTGSTWFDSKQEICHLLGIVFYILENKPKKAVHFLNVAANYSYDQISVPFCVKGEDMVMTLLRDNNISIDFDYQLCGVRDFFGSLMLLDKKGYKTDRTIRELIAEKTLYEAPIR